MADIPFDPKIHRPLAEDDTYFDCPGFFRSDTAYYCVICSESGLLQKEEEPNRHATSDYHIYRLYHVYDPVPPVPFWKCPQLNCSVALFSEQHDMSTHCEEEHGKTPADIVWEQFHEADLAKICRVYWKPPCPPMVEKALTPRPGDLDRDLVETFHRICADDPTFDFSNLSEDDLARYSRP